jgi:hypothetical protein
MIWPLKKNEKWLELKFKGKRPMQPRIRWFCQVLEVNRGKSWQETKKEKKRLWKDIRLEYKMESMLVEKEEGPAIAPPYSSCQHITYTYTADVKHKTNTPLQCYLKSAFAPSCYMLCALLCVCVCACMYVLSNIIYDISLLSSSISPICMINLFENE